MNKYAIEYTEKYSQVYFVEADDYKKAYILLHNAIANGDVYGPDDCIGTETQDVTDEFGDIPDNEVDVRQ